MGRRPSKFNSNQLSGLSRPVNLTLTDHSLRQKDWRMMDEASLCDTKELLKSRLLCIIANLTECDRHPKGCNPLHYFSTIPISPSSRKDI